MQVVGCAASLADLGRNQEALELFGAAEMVHADWLDPFVLTVYAARLVEWRTAARDALSSAVADAAYARGRALRIDEVVLAAAGIAATVTATT